MQKTFVGKTRDGANVYVDMESSHAATHFADTPNLFGLVQEILPQIEAKDGLRFEVDMGRVVGEMDLVETGEGDDVVYAKRPNRDTYSRFVKSRNPVPTSFVTLELAKEVGDNEYSLRTAYVGRLTPPFPGDPGETKESKPFWSTHALAWGTQEIVPETETEICPW